MRIKKHFVDKKPLIIIIFLLTREYNLCAQDTVQTKTNIDKNKPKVALVLSGGSARGFAHIGVISVLEEYEIPIDLIVGVSMGSIVGGYYAYGYSTSQLLAKSKEFKLSNIIDIKPGGKGILSGEKELAIFKRDIDDANIENTKIPLIIVATDLTEKNIHIFDRGNLAIAMRASSAIPGIFPPLTLNGHILVDGGVLDDVPVDIARENGADVVIVSNVAVIATLYSHGLRKSILELAIDLAKRKRLPFIINKKRDNGVNVVAESLQLLEKGYSRVTSSATYKADMEIKPLDDEIHAFDFDKAEEAYRLGREATLRQIQRIIELTKR